MKPELSLSPRGLALAVAMFAIGSSAALAQDNNVDEDSDEVETIVVTGSRFEQNIEDVAGSISVMDSATIENQMVTDMSQLFRYEPGVRITGSNGTAQNLVVRGMGADRVMMIKDGMRMNEGYGADGANDVVGRGFIDMDTIKQVEVAKGAASSLYGADAVGGIAAFTTKDASDFLGDDDFHGAMNLDYDGRSSQAGAGALTAFRLGNFETLVSYKYRDGNETENYNDDRQGVDVESNSLLIKTDYVIDSERKLTLSADLYDQDVTRPDDGEPKGDYVGLPGWTINRQESWEDKSNDSYRMGYKSNGSAVAFMDSLDINVYYNDTEQTDDYLLNHDTPAPMGPGGSRDQIKADRFEQETWGASFSAGKQLGNADYSHHLSYGFDWDTSETFRPRSEQRIQSDGTVVRDDYLAPFPKNDTERFGAYLQDTIDIGEKLTIVPGLRYDHYSMDPDDDEGYSNSIGDSEVAAEKISDDNLSWRLGTIYEIADGMSVYAQYSEGFKVPPYDLAYFYFDHVSFSGNGIRIIPAADLEPEESDSYEIGVRISRGGVSFTASVYTADYDNFIQIAYVETVSEVNYDFGFPFPLDVDVFQYQNIESAEISGVELGLNLSITDSLSMFLNGEWMDSEDKTTGEQLSTIQPFNGTVGATWSQERFALDAMLRWADRMDKNPSDAFKTSGYGTVDLYARYDISDKFTIAAGVLNAFDKEYIEYSSVAGIPDDGRDLNLYTEPGRTVSARLNYRF